MALLKRVVSGVDVRAPTRLAYVVTHFPYRSALAMVDDGCREYRPG